MDVVLFNLTLFTEAKMDTFAISYWIIGIIIVLQLFGISSTLRDIKRELKEK